MRALLQLKYRPNRRLAKIMGKWLAGMVLKTNWNAKIIIPVPLGEARKKQRGYNQAELIAQEMARELMLPCEPNYLMRIRETNSQVGLVPIQRWKNVAGAFITTSSIKGIEGVILVDDLRTTGATLSSCAYTIRQAGGRRVCAATVAQAR